MKNFNWMLYVMYPIFVLVVSNFGIGFAGMFMSSDVVVAVTILIICFLLIVVMYFAIKKTF